MKGDFSPFCSPLTTPLADVLDINFETKSLQIKATYTSSMDEDQLLKHACVGAPHKLKRRLSLANFPP